MSFYENIDLYNHLLQLWNFYIVGTIIYLTNINYNNFLHLFVAYYKLKALRAWFIFICLILTTLLLFLFLTDEKLRYHEVK